MKTTDYKMKNILSVEPFKRILPLDDVNYPIDMGDGVISGDLEVLNRVMYEYIPQSVFLTELYPSGHKILNKNIYPDIYTQIDVENDDGTKSKRWARKKISRLAIPFQYVIKTQQNIHLCGHPIFFKDSNLKPNTKSKDLLAQYKQKWLDDNMESSFYSCVDSEKCTGNCAIAFYFEKENGKTYLRNKTYSYLDGYTICRPIIDISTGKKLVQAIKYVQYDDNGNGTTYFADVWDNRYFYRFKQDRNGVKGIINKALSQFGLENYSLISQVEHQFPFMPIATKRNRIGACWTPVQHGIENYEINASQLCDNGKVLSTAILFIKGGQADIQNMADGRPFAIISKDSNADAKILTRENASSALDTTLKIVKENIFLGSFTVLPPEVHSGDLPGIAIKLIYSPSLEKAMDDAADWNFFIDEMVKIHKYGSSVIIGSELNAMNINGSIIPYVHENTAEMINSICQSKLAGLTSVETGALRIPFNTNDEYRIIEEEAKKNKELEEQEVNAMLSTTKTNDGMNPSNMAKQSLNK